MGYGTLGSCTHANLTVLGTVSPKIPESDGTCTIAGQEPTPSPAPPGCDASACIDRCVSKYDEVASGKKGYYCAKGCAGAKAGEVTDLDKFCKIDAQTRQSECESDCNMASGSNDNVKACKYGCSYWAI